MSGTYALDVMPSGANRRVRAKSANDIPLTRATIVFASSKPLVEYDHSLPGTKFSPRCRWISVRTSIPSSAIGRRPVQSRTPEVWVSRWSIVTMCP